MDSERPRVSVVMGGPSAEHAISLKSGQGVVAALAHRGWPVAPVVIPHDITIEAASLSVRLALERSGADVVFIALHGPFGEDGTIQQICEDLHLAYSGSGPQASRLGLDKVESRKRFEQHGLAVPRWRLLDPQDEGGIIDAITRLGFPVVVKPTNQGSSLGVSLAANHGQLQEAVAEAARYDARILLEEFVRGREMTVGIVGQEPLPVVEIKPAEPFFDYTAKYTPGRTTYLVPAPLEEGLTRRVQAAGRRAHEALGCRHFSRADLIMRDGGEPVVLEVNTIPGLTATSLLPKAAACVGLSYDALCERLVLMAIASRPRATAQPVAG